MIRHNIDSLLIDYFLKRRSKRISTASQLLKRKWAGMKVSELSLKFNKLEDRFMTMITNIPLELGMFPVVVPGMVFVNTQLEQIKGR